MKAEIKTDTHIVIKLEDIPLYLSDEQANDLMLMLRTIDVGRKADNRKTDNRYYVCNTDEPYAETVIDAILRGEDDKWFFRKY